MCAVDISEVDDALAYLGCHADVVTLDPMTLDEVIESVRLVGRATGPSRGPSESSAVPSRSTPSTAASAAPTSPTLVLEWTDPPFTAGHWVPDLVTAAGGRPGAPPTG